LGTHDATSDINGKCRVSYKNITKLHLMVYVKLRASNGNGYKTQNTEKSKYLVSSFTLSKTPLEQYSM
jgi:hypothetical protein